MAKTTETAAESIEEGLKGYFSCATATETLSGIPIKERYGPEDVKDIDFEKDIGEPGEYPFTRGVFPNMYRGRLWSISQLAGFWSGAETNKRLKYLLSCGQTSINTISDNPSNHCIDPDHPIAGGDAGVQGIPTAILQDMEDLTDGIPLDLRQGELDIQRPPVFYLPSYVSCHSRKERIRYFQTERDNHR
jgi:methylmalonyl-CoA mutase N-terminal domain/subunit